MQLYTSGTTGLPKGAMLTNANLGTLVPHVAPRWGFDASSVNVIAMPLFHIGGSGWALCGMWHGCHSILFRDFVPQDVLAVPTEGTWRVVATAGLGGADADFLATGAGEQVEVRHDG